MKRMIPVLLAAAVLASCGSAADEPDAKGIIAVSDPDSPAEVTTSETMTVLTAIEPPLPDVVTGGVMAATQQCFDSLTDDDIISIYFAGYSSDRYVNGYYRPAVRTNDFVIAYAPEDADFDAWSSDIGSFAPDATSAELILEDEVCIAYRVEKDGTPDSSVILIPRFLRMADGGVLRYTGGRTSEEIAKTVDILTQYEFIIARDITERDNGLAYDYIAIHQNEKGTALELSLKSCFIDEDGTMQTSPAEIDERSISTGTDPSEQETDREQYDNDCKTGVMDMGFRASRTELDTDDEDYHDYGEGAGEVLFFAEVPIGVQEPLSVELLDADTGTVIGNMVDTARFEEDGDDIKGDGVFSCRYTFDLDIDTDPDVSEQKEYNLYARFTDSDGVLHISAEPVTVTLYEPFTDTELDAWQRVSDEIKELRNSNEFKKSSPDERADMVVELLKGFAAEGIIIEESIRVNDYYPKSVVYKCKNGPTCIIEVQERDKRCN